MRAEGRSPEPRETIAHFINGPLDNQSYMIDEVISTYYAPVYYPERYAPFAPLRTVRPDHKIGTYSERRIADPRRRLITRLFVWNDDAI